MFITLKQLEEKHLALENATEFEDFSNSDKAEAEPASREQGSSRATTPLGLLLA